jgi:primosomal protein N'
VSSFADETEFDDVRSIVDLVCSFPIVDKYEIDMIFKLAKRYFLPIHRVLNLFFPKFIFNRFEKNAFEDTYNLRKVNENPKKEVTNELIHNIS